MKSIYSIAAAAALCATGIAPALAQGTTFTNGTFGTSGAPSLANWTTAGDVAVVGSKALAAMTTASFTNQDDPLLPAGFNNLSGTSAVDLASAPDLAGILRTSLNTAGGATSFEGSAIRQNFIATAGDTLTVTFDWTFLSADKTNADFGFIAINGTVVKFVDAFSAPAASSFNGSFGDFSQVTWGWTTASYTYTAASSGSVSMVLGVVDVGNKLNTSELRVDNIGVSAVSAVPETETFAMLLAGLGLVGNVVRRRRAKLA